MPPDTLLTIKAVGEYLQKQFPGLGDDAFLIAATVITLVRNVDKGV